MSRQLPIVLVPGTWGWSGHETTGQWYQPAKKGDRPSFYDLLCEAGYRPLTFVWSTSLGGVFWQKKRRLDWDAAGANLAVFLDPHREEIGTDHICPVISHSHGAQLVHHALAFYGATIPVWLDVAGPVRDDMMAVARLGRPQNRTWYHFYANWSDKMQILGQLFDGAVNIVRKHPLADYNIDMNGAGHSGILHPSHYSMWKTEGWNQFLKGGWK